MNGLRVLAIFSPELGELSFYEEGVEAFGEAEFQDSAEKIRGVINELSATVGGVSACSDNVLVIKVLLGLHFGSQFAYLFQLSTLLYFAGMAGLIVPMALLHHYKAIGEHFSFVLQGVQGAAGVIFERIPSAAKEKERKYGKRK